MKTTKAARPCALRSANFRSMRVAVFSVTDQLILPELFGWRNVTSASDFQTNGFCDREQIFVAPATQVHDQEMVLGKRWGELADISQSV